MAPIDFTISHQFNASSRRLWDEMIDWPSHARWIPATRVVIDSGDPQSVGAMFTGYTGFGKLSLVDRMRISVIEWDEETQRGTCEVEKLGPVLQGTAGFDVSPNDDGCTVDWFEHVTVPYLPKILSPIVNKLSASGLEFGMYRLAKIIDREDSPRRENPREL